MRSRDFLPKEECFGVLAHRKTFQGVYYEFVSEYYYHISFLVWAIWLIPYFSPMLFGMAI